MIEHRPTAEQIESELRIVRATARILRDQLRRRLREESRRAREEHQEKTQGAR